MKRLVAVIAGFLMITACSSTPTMVQDSSAQGGPEGFFQVKGLQQFSEVWLKSETALDNYRRVVFSDLDLSGLEIDKTRLTRGDDYWVLTEQDVLRSQEYYRAQLDTFYGKERNLERVTEAGEATLKVDMALVKYMPNAPKDTTRGRSAGQSYFAEGAGRLYMTANITDASTGELLMVVENDRELGSSWQRDNRINNLRRYKQGLYTWIQRIDKAVAEVQSGLQ